MFKNLVFFALLIGILGCGTENPLCTENYCIVGEIFPKEELNGREFDELPASVNEEKLIELLTYKEKSPDTDIFPITITGVVSWEIGDDTWTEWIDGDRIIHQITLEFKIPGYGFFDETKIILVDLNNPQYGEKDGIEYVDFLGGGIIGGKSTTVKLTEWLSPAHFKGDIVGAPIIR